MTNARIKYNTATEIALATQVEGVCPLCGKSLFYVKKKMSHKAYELAHIYPLNPTDAEKEELRGVVQLHSDVNHPDNLIPLCESCHGEFDKPRTAEGYNALAEEKRRAIRRSAQQALQVEYPIEDDIRRIVEALHTDDVAVDDSELEYDPKKLRDKFDSSLPRPTRQKITYAVTDYYGFIKKQFLEIERETPSASQLIYTQVKSFYLKQKSLGLTQPEIFTNVVGWIEKKTKPQTIEAAEIVASFFVQNCEVFG